MIIVHVLNDYKKSRLSLHQMKNTIAAVFRGEGKNNSEVNVVLINDKTMKALNGKYLDHWIKIRELEVDGIKFETCLYNACIYQHNMPDQWVQQQIQNGHVIDKEYPHGTDIRLNGTWTINFSTPIWQWCVQRLDQ